MSEPDKIFDVALINQRRDRWARHAKAQDFLLRRVGEDLSDRLHLVQRDFPLTLILGAHHGVVGEELKTLPRLGDIISADASKTLLQSCAGLKVCADQEWLPFRDASLDLIISPLALHYANDLPGTLVQIRRALKNDGLFLAAMLGGATLKELRQAWLRAEAELFDGAAPRVAPFADLRDVGSLLQRAGFAMPVVDTERITVTYASPLAMMQELKAMAGSNPLRVRSKRPVTKRLLKRASEIYRDEFAHPETGRIPATFDILTLSAWAPDKSQQQPLKPGSAKMRLSEALGVAETSRKYTEK